MPGFKQIKDKNHDTCFFGRHRGFSFTFFIYANNEPKSALARDLGDCRDNKQALLAYDVHSREDGNGPKRPRSARECAEIHF